MSTALRSQLQATLGDAYTIDRELGGGGMSHVFVATESALGRQIVVKVLPPDAAAAVSAARFKREIQVAAKLQHPHIVPVLWAGESNGLPFYTMPFVKGESLRARLAKGGELSINESTHVLRDIASALAYAHGEGIVHRDIKPENIILSGGVAVVTDFGIAKAVDVAAAAAGDEVRTTGITGLGVAIGTPAYMAPEQAMAEEQVDHRADIYSFGCVAYEMLTGSAPFAGRSLTQLLAAHVSEAPAPLAGRRPNVSPALASLVMKCLEKRAADRPQRATDLLAALDSIATPGSGGLPASQPVGRSGSLARYGIAAALLVGVPAFGAWWWTQRNTFIQVQSGPTMPLVVTPELEGEPAISPDGKFLAYTATTEKGTRIFMRQIAGERGSAIADDITGDQSWARWSPDGLRISFVAQGSIWVVPALGGTARKLVDSASTHAWSPNGKQLAYQSPTGLWVRDVDGTSRRQLFPGSEFHSPAWSPDGRLIAFGEGLRLTMGNTSSSMLWVVPAAGGVRTRISDSAGIYGSPQWMPDGRSLLFVTAVGGNRDVYQQPVSPDGHPVGERFRLTTLLSPFVITLSADGTRMAYDMVHNYSNIWWVPLPSTGMARIENATQLTKGNQRVEAMAISHDGKWIAFDSDRLGSFDIYKMKLDGGEPIQLTTNASNEFHPTWSPDDQHIAFHSARVRGIRQLYIMKADGSDETQLTHDSLQKFVRDFTPDGRAIAFGARNTGIRATQVRYIELQKDGTWFESKLISDAEDRRSAGITVWSPDGRSAAFTLNGGVAVATIATKATRMIVDSAALGGTGQGLFWSDPATLYVSVGPGRYNDNILFTLVRTNKIVAVDMNTGRVRTVLEGDRTHRIGREEFAIAGGRLYFTLAAWESDAGVMELVKKH